MSNSGEGCPQVFVESLSALKDHYAILLSMPEFIINQRSIRHGIAWALLLALTVALVPTIMDWYNNPGGVFRGTEGTNWGVVLETTWTWFWPLFLIAVPITVLFWAWRDKPR